MQIDTRQDRAARLDRFCVMTGALLPVGIAIGNVAFEAVLALVGLAWIARSVVARYNPLPDLLHHPMVPPWLAWYVAILLPLVANGAGLWSWGSDIVYFRHLVFFVALLDISQRMEVARYLVGGLAVGVLWGLCNTVVAHLVGYDLVGHPVDRYLHKLKEASRISGICTFAGPFFIGWSLLDHKLTRHKRLGLGALGVIGLLLVGYFHMRTPFLAALAGSVVIGGIILRRRFSIRTLFFLAGVLVASSVLIMQYNRLFDLKNLYGRFYIWGVTWEMWKEHPFFGVTVAEYRDVFGRVVASGSVPDVITPAGEVYTRTRGDAAYHAHNLFLMLLATTGITGFLSFMWLYGTCAVRSVRDLTGWRYGLMPWSVIFFVVGLASWNIYDNFYLALTAFFMVLIGIAPSAGDLD